MEMSLPQFHLQATKHIMIHGCDVTKAYWFIKCQVILCFFLFYLNVFNAHKKKCKKKIKIMSDKTLRSALIDKNL